MLRWHLLVLASLSLLSGCGDGWLRMGFPDYVASSGPAAENPVVTIDSTTPTTPAATPGALTPTPGGSSIFPTTATARREEAGAGGGLGAADDDEGLGRRPADLGRSAGPRSRDLDRGGPPQDRDPDDDWQRPTPIQGQQPPHPPKRPRKPEKPSKKAPRPKPKSDHRGPRAELEIAEELLPVLELTNAFRESYRLPPLTWNPKLARAARAHAERMASEGFFDHRAPDGTTPGDRLAGVGYAFEVCGENIAAGYSNGDEAMGAWIESPSHRQNLLNERYTELGVGVAEARSSSGRPRLYWVQEFGLPRPVWTGESPGEWNEPERAPRPRPADGRGSASRNNGLPRE